MSPAEKLQIILQLSKLTQSELAQRLKVSFPTINSWVNERSQPRKKNIEAIDRLYKKLTGQKSVPKTKKTAKRNLIKIKSEKEPDLLQFIQNRQDLYDQLLLSFTYNTNSIEGSTLTENETASILFEGITIKNKDLVEHLEVKNHQRALAHLFDVTSTMNNAITEKFVLRLHEILMTGIRGDAGHYRTHGVRIVGSNVPTSNHLSIPKHMTAWIQSVNRRPNDLINHLAATHAQFEQIHPFSDGNGRIGRLIMAGMLLQENIAPAVIKKEKKMTYYKNLKKAQLNDDLDGLEDFMCDAILNGFGLLGL